jgi:hypothetical protein
VEVVILRLVHKEELEEQILAVVVEEEMVLPVVQEPEDQV